MTLRNFTLYFCIISYVKYVFTSSKSQLKILSKDNTEMIQPPYLKAGDTVAIVAPSGILKNREAKYNKLRFT